MEETGEYMTASIRVSATRCAEVLSFSGIGIPWTILDIVVRFIKVLGLPLVHLRLLSLCLSLFFFVQNLPQTVRGVLGSIYLYVVA